MTEETKADLGAFALVRDHVRSEQAAGDEQAKALVERPLGEDVVEKIVAKASGEGSASASAKASANANAKGGVVVSLWRRVAIVAAPIAVAAAIFVYVGGRAENGGAPLLPEFAVTASGEKEMRGAAEEASGMLRLRGAEGSFEILARPATAVGGVRVVAYVFAIGEGEPNAVDANVEVAPEGSVRIRGRARALMGAREVRVVLAAATDGGASITRYEEALAAARSGKSDERVRVLIVKLVRE